MDGKIVIPGAKSGSSSIALSGLFDRLFVPADFLVNTPTNYPGGLTSRG
jgi:hypothetical protein